jgi:hypothetical protein
VNDHRYTMYGGRPVTTDSDRDPIDIVAVLTCTCPTCGSVPGYYCQSERGLRIWPPHDGRYTPITTPS